MSLFLHLNRQNNKHWGFALLVLLFGVALDVSDTRAQSGRRNPPASSVNATPPAPVSPTAKPDAQPLAPGGLPSKVRLLVARQPTSKHLQSEDQIFANFAKQLSRYDNVEATSLGDLKEGQAVERAKAESETFVVLLKFEIDSFQDGAIIVNAPDLEVEYLVLAPRTGKRQTKGKVFYQAISGPRARRRDSPSEPPIKITPEAAGIEAADALYYWLKLTMAEKTRQ